MKILIIIFYLLLNLFAAGGEKIKVFILAGQSNMVGKAKISLLEHQCNDMRTKKRFAHFTNGGKWVQRDDVYIAFRKNKGKLSIGNFAAKGCIGPEYDLGHALGDYYKEEVLLIKVAWGGRSLVKDFRPPSSGGPGKNYKMMIQEVQESLMDRKNISTKLNKEYEISGFFWFHGWNDMIDQKATSEYTKNLTNLIIDIRNDFKTPLLPVVIVGMGVNANDADSKILNFREQQKAVLKNKEFIGNVLYLDTVKYWDLEAHKVFKKGWREHFKEWQKVGSDYAYHYYGSPLILSDIGRGMAELMIKLGKSK